MSFFGMGAGPYQKQSGQTEIWQPVQHTAMAIGVMAVMVAIFYVWALLIGRIFGPVLLALWCVFCMYIPRNAQYRAVCIVGIIPALAFSYAGIYGPWPVYTITWEYWPWVQFGLVFFLPLSIYPLAILVERQLNESLFPNLLNSVKATPGQMQRRLPVSGIRYAQGDEEPPQTSVTWSA